MMGMEEKLGKNSKKYPPYLTHSLPVIYCGFISNKIKNAENRNHNDDDVALNKK